MAIDYSTVARISLEVKKFIENRWLSSTNEKSREIFNKEFKTRMLREDEKRDAERIWSAMADFVCEELTKSLSMSLPADIKRDHIQLSIEIIREMMIKNSFDYSIIANFLGNPVGTLRSIVHEQSIVRSMSDNESSVFRVCLSKLFEIISQLYLYIPVFEVEKSNFQTMKLVKIHAQLEEVRKNLDSLAASTINTDNLEFNDYERLYRIFLIRILDELPVVGIKFISDAPIASLSVGYIDLDIIYHDQATTGRPLIITGGAGQGKTTFLKFIASNCAVNRIKPQQIYELRDNINTLNIINFISEDKKSYLFLLDFAI